MMENETVDMLKISFVYEDGMYRLKFTRKGYHIVDYSVSSSYNNNVTYTSTSTYTPPLSQVQTLIDNINNKGMRSLVTIKNEINSLS